MAIKIKEEESGFVVYRPYGMLSKENRERADKLDEVLTAEIPRITNETLERPESKNVIAKWHFFGKEMSKILDNPELVLRSDIASGDIWWAIRQKAPERLGIKGAGQARKSKSVQNGSRDTLACAYALAQFDWDDIGWLERWTDWNDLYSRDVFWQDVRILKALKDNITRLKPYPSRPRYRAILKAVSKELRSNRNTKQLPDSEIESIVKKAVLEQ